MKKLASKTYLVLIFAFLYVPILIMMALSFNQSKSRAVWAGFSTRWYSELWKSASIMSAVRNTFTIALLSSAVATVIGVVACIGIIALSRRMRTVTMAVNNIPLLNADIVTGLSLMLTYVFFGVTLGYGTIVLAHITFNIPYVVLSVMPRLKNSSRSTYEAAMDLGASPVRAFFSVVMPEIAPGIVSGFLLSFSMSIDDFIITHFTKGAGVNTISTMIYAQVRRGIVPSMYALSTILFVVVMILLLITNFAPAAFSRDDAKKGKTT